MNKQYKVLVNTGKAEDNQTLSVTQGQGAKGQPLRIPAKAGVKYQLQEIDKNKEAAPEYVKVKRVGKHLHILLEGSEEADIIIEDYYEVMPEGYNAVVGQAENGSFYEYIPEDPDVKGLIPELADGGQAVSVALGGSEVVGAGAAVGILAFNPLLAGLGLLGAGAAAAAATGTTTGTTLTVNPVTSDNNLSTAEQANATTAVTGTVSGNFTAGDTVTLTVHGKTYTGQVNANGTYSIDVPTADLVDDVDKQIEASVAATGASGNTTANATHAYTINAEGGTDTAPPTIAVSADSTSLAAGANTTVRFTLSEASTNFTADDVTVVGGTLSNFQGSGTSYTATFTPAANATSAAIVVASDKFSDAAGNLNKDGADTNNTVSLRIGGTSGSTSLVVNAITQDNNLDLTEQGNATTAVSGTVSGNFSAGNTVTLNINGKLFTGTVTANGTYSIDVPTTDLVADDDQQIQASIAATGAAGNTTASATHTYTLSTNPNADTTAPMIAVSADSLSLATGATTTVRFILSEASTNFTADDVTVVGGTLSNFQGSGTSYTATFTPTANATSAAIVVASDKFSDAAGNLNKDGADTNNTVSLTIGNGNPIIGSTSLIINSVTDDNILSAAEQGQTSINVTGKVSGAFAVGNTVTLTIAGAAYQGTVLDAAGNYSIAVPTTALQADLDKRIDGTVTGTGGTPASAIQNYSVEDTTPINPDPYNPPNSGEKTAISIDAITGDNVLAANESGSINVTGKVSGAFAVGNTVTLYVNGTTYTGAVLDAAGNYSIAVPAAALLADKDSKIEADVTGTGGDKATAQQDYIVEANPAAPTQTALTINPITGDNLITAGEKSGSIAVTGKVSGKFAVGDTVTLTVGGKAYTGAVTDTAGNYSVSVPAADIVADSDSTITGSVSGTGGSTANALQNYIVEGTTPGNLATGALDAASDTGTKGDNTTNDRTPDLSGTVPAGSTATVTINGLTYPVTVKPDGTWSFTQPTNLPDGTYYPVLNVTTNGVTQPTNITPFTVDATAPTIAISANASTLGAGQSTTVTFTLSEASGDFTADDIQVSGGTLGSLVQSATNPLVYTASFTPAATGTSATISVASDKFSDAAGNLNQDGAEANNSVTLTTNASTYGGLDPSSDSGTQGDNKTNDTTPTMSGKVPAGSTASITINGVKYPVNVNPDGTWSFTNPTNLPDGTYTPVLDVVTNGQSNSTPLTPFTIDTQAPTIAITANAQALASGQTATITFTLSEASGDFTAADIQVSGGTLGSLVQSATNPLVYTASFTPAATGTSATISVASDKFSDAAGNLNQDGADANNSVSLSINASVTGQLSAASDNTTGTPNDGKTNDATPEIIGKVPAGSSATITINGQTYPINVNPDGSYSFTQPANLPDGTYTPVINVITNGQTTSTPVTPFTIDTQAPTVAITSPVTTLAAGQSATLTFTVSEATNNLTDADIQVTGGILSALVQSATNPLVYTATFTAAAGATSASVKIDSNKFSDAAGNNNQDGSEANNTWTYTIPPITPPNTDSLTALTIEPITGDNVLSATEQGQTSITVKGQVTGKFAAGDVVSLVVGGQTVTATVGADGSYVANVPVSAFKADADLKIEGSVKGTGGDTATAAQTYTLENTDTPVKTALAIDPITADNIIGVSEATGDITVTGKVTGKFSAGDTVTLTINGKTFPATVAADGSFSAKVPAVDLLADSDTTVDGRVTGSGGTTATAVQNYGIDPNVDPVPPPTLKTTVTIDAITGDNLINASELASINTTVSGKVTGAFQAGDKVTLTLNGKDYVTSVDANGAYSVSVLTADLQNDPDTKIEASVNGTGGSFASAAQDYVIDSGTTPSKTTLSINPVTADNIINASEAAASAIAVTGKVGGKFAVNDTVTLTVNGNSFTGTVTDTAGNFTVNVPTADLLADSDSTIDGTITGTGGTPASAVQNYGIDTTPVNPDPYDPPNTGDKTAISIDAITGDNVLAANESGSINVTGKVSGAFAVGNTVTLYVNGTTYTGTVLDAAGNYSIAVPATALLADNDSKIEADVTGTGGDKATAAQDYIVEANPAAPTQTAISVDPVTADNVIAGAEKTGSINVTGTVTGKFAQGDKVTLSINGKTYTGLAAANGRYTIAVPAADLIADSDTTVEASVTLSGNIAPVAAVTEVANPLKSLIAPELTITDNVSATTVANGGSVVFTFKFSEPVTDFTDAYITVTNGIKGTFAGSGDTYTLTVTAPTGTASGATTVSVADGSYTSATTGLAGQGAAAGQLYGTAPVPSGDTITLAGGTVATRASHFRVGDKIFVLDRNADSSGPLDEKGAITQIDPETGAAYTRNLVSSLNTGTAFYGFPYVGVSPNTDSNGNFFVASDTDSTIDYLSITTVNSAGVPQLSKQITFSNGTALTGTFNQSAAWVIDDNTVGILFAQSTYFRVISVNPATGVAYQTASTSVMTGTGSVRPFETTLLSDGSVLMTVDGLSTDSKTTFMRFSGSSLTPVQFDIDVGETMDNFRTVAMNDGNVLTVSSSGGDYYLTKVDPIAGTKIGSTYSFNIATGSLPGGFSAYNTVRGDVAVLEDGAIVITSIAYGGPNGAFGVWATVLNSDYSVRVAPFMVDTMVTYDAGGSEKVSVVELGNGGFQIVYQDGLTINNSGTLSGSSTNLVAVNFGPDGTIVNTGATLNGTDTFTGGEKDDTFTANGGADIILAGGGNAPVISVYADDTGTATGDFGTGTITDDTTPTIKGTAEAGSTVKLYTSTGTLLGTTTADANGDWTYTPTTPLAEATYNLVATATDAAGNVSALSNSFNLEINSNIAPVANPTSVISPLKAQEAPTVTITDNISTSTVAVNTPVTFTLTFSEAPASGTLTASDIKVQSVSGTTVTDITAFTLAATSDPKVWTVTANAPTSGSGTLQVQVANGSYTGASTGLAGQGASGDQRYGKEPVPTETDPVTYSTNYQVSMGQPVVLSNGNIVKPLSISSTVAWVEILSPDGSLLKRVTVDYSTSTTTGEGRVRSSYQPIITPTSDGGFYMSWPTTSSTDTSSNLAFQKFDADGNTMGANVGFSMVFTHDLSGSSSAGWEMTEVNANRIAVAYTHNSDVLLRVYDRDLSTGAHTLFKTITLQSPDAASLKDSNPRITTVSDNGDFVVAWRGQDVNTTGDRSLYVQKFDASGNAIGALQKLESPVSTSTNDANHEVTALGNGEYAVTWAAGKNGGTDPYNYDVFSQRFNADGSVKGSVLTLHSATGTTSGEMIYNLSVTTEGLADGEYIVNWDTPGSYLEYTAKVSAQGTVTSASTDNTTPSKTFTAHSGIANQNPLIDDTLVINSQGDYVFITGSDSATGTSLDMYLVYANAQGEIFATQKYSLVPEISGTALGPLEHRLVKLEGDNNFAILTGGSVYQWNGSSYVPYNPAYFSNSIIFNDGTLPAATNTITGTTGADTLVGLTVNDIITAAGGADKIFGGGGNDTIIINTSNITQLGATTALAMEMVLDGGAGTNTLRIGNSGTLDLTNSVVADKVRNFSHIDITGTANNTLKLDYDAVIRTVGVADNTSTQADESRMMVVNGNAGDTLQLAGTWTAGATSSGADLAATYGSAYGFASGTNYVAYTLNDATVFMSAAMTVSTGSTVTPTNPSTVGWTTDGATVATLFGPSFTDANTTQTFKGVAVVGNATNYQYSTNGGSTWTNMPTVSDGSALFLAPDAQIRYNSSTGTAPTNLQVRLVDSSGLTGTASLTSGQTGVNALLNGGTTAFSGNVVELVFDTAAPSAPVISVYADDTGTATGDFGTGTITDDTTPTLKGTAEAGSTVKLYTSAGTYVGSTTADANGDWTYTPTTPLAEATYNLVATATDAAGNVSALSNSFALTVDVNTAPVATQPTTTVDPWGTAKPIYDTFIKGTTLSDTTITANSTYTFGSTTATVSGNTGSLTSTDPSVPSYVGTGLWIGDAADETLRVDFSKAVYEVVIKFSVLTNTGSGNEKIVIFINGERYPLSSSEVTPNPGTGVSLNADGEIVASYGSLGQGLITIRSQPGTEGITRVDYLNDWISGTPAGTVIKISASENTSTPTAVATDAVSVATLFGASYSDSDSDAMKGVLVTAAGDATAQASLGNYQYSTDGGTTWTNIASSLSETNALYLPSTALVRFSAVAGNTLTAKPSFTAHLVDSYSLSPNYTAGQTYDASVNGGSTSISEDTVTLGLPASDVSVSTAASVNEGTASVFTVSLPNNTGGYSDLAYSLSGAATAADYGSAIFSNGVTQNADGTLKVPAGVTSFTVTLPIVADKTTEGAEVLTMTVGAASASTTINDTSNGSNTNPVITPTDAIIGAANQTFSGKVVANVGDFNGDGLDDVIIGAPGTGTVPGKAYVVFGNTNSFTGLQLSDVANGNGGFVINGDAANYRVGEWASSAGDVNGDGLSDVIVGGSSGKGFVVYGTTASTSINVSSLTSSSVNGFVINGPSSGALVSRVSSAGDVNGDGYADQIVRVNTEAYVVFGSSTSSTINLASWSSGAGGYKITGLAGAGSVSNAGDINGDGLSDVIISDPSKTTSTGAAYVIYGTTASATTINVATLAASQGFTMNGQAASDQFGTSVSAAGDVNGDGLADVIIGAQGVGTERGRSYVVFGTSGAPASINMASVAAGIGGFVINGQCTSDFSGYSVSSAGDINGDGLSDLIVGAYGANNTGRAYVVYGMTGSTTPVQLSAVANGSGGFVINGQCSSDNFGTSVSAAGDMNGDGYADLIVGASDANNFTAQGRSYIIYGGSQYISGTVATGTGTAADELVVGTGSGDTLTGGGGVDRFSGGAGNDTVVLTASDVSNLANTAVGGVKAYVAGGEGYDTVQLSGTNLNLTTITNAGAVTGATGEQLSRINSIERIDLATDTAANTLTLTATDVKDMAGFNTIRTGTPSADGKTWTNVSGTALGTTTPYHQMVVEGDSLDKLSIVTTLGGWVQVGVVSNGTTQYKVLQNEQTRSQLIVDARVQTVIDPNTQPIAPINLTSMAITNGGYDVSYAGDVNGDGIDDMVVSAFSGSILSNTKSYVVFGTTGNLMPLALTAMTASQGFAINDPTGGMRTVHYAGDLNGDGLSDVILGQPNEGSSSGAAYVVYGKTDGNLVTVGANMGTSGFMIDSTGNTSQFGTEVSTAGDFNGDGIADLLVGASAGGNAYILYGSTNATNITYSGPGSLGTQGLELVNGGAGFGITVSNAGDINGDGLSDVIVGGNGTINQGMDYVVFGRTASGSLDMGTMGTGGLKILGNATSEYANAVAGAGDVNGDGVADLLIGAYGTDEAYVVFGGASLAGTSINVTSVGSTTPGFKIVDTAGNFGINVSYAGDINGDGLADMLVGSNTSNPNGTSSGRSYVVYGKTSSTTVFASDLRLGVGGFVINGVTANDQQGFGVSNGGDLNGDGYDDLLVSSNKAGSTVGSSYVIYGGAQYVSNTIALGSGTSADELVVGSNGSDTLTGGGGVDRFSAAAGDDTVVLAASDVTNLANNVVGNTKAMVDGGGGFDTVRLSGGTNLDLTTITNIDSMGGMGTSRINSIERIDMATDTAANTLTLTARDVNDMAGFDQIHLGVSEDGKTWTNVSGTALGTTTPYHQLVVDGDSNDSLVLPPGTGSWGIVGKVNNGSTDYWVYQNDATRSQVLVNSAMPIAVNTQPESVNVTYRGLEDAAAPTSGTLGVRVGDLESLAGSDVNNDSLGIAITGQNTLFTGTTLYYSTNGGSSWNPLTASNYSDTNALLLNADARLYLVGAADTAGTLSRLFVRLWDGTDGGTSGNTKNISGLTGPSGAYSATTSELGWSITNVNDAPTLSVTTLATAATYSGSPVTLFSGALANAGPTNESSQKFVGLRLQAGGLKDGADERLTIDGTTFSLTNGSTTTTTNGWTVSVSNSTGVSATVTLSKTAGATATDVNTLINDIQYTNTATTKTSGARDLRVSYLQDDGGTANGGVDAVTLNGTYSRVLIPVAPVVLDLDRDGQIEYTQQLMDANLDGQLDQSAWASREDGVLVWDKFGTGEVKDLSQYAFTAFGGETDLQGLAAGFDSNADGVLDAQDAKFAEFGVWQDADGDGTADAGEVRSLDDVGIVSIDLQSDGVARTPADGVTEAGRTEATMADGSTMQAADAAFTFNTVPVLNLDVVLKDGVADMTDGKAELLKINLNDLLQLPTTADGKHVLQVNGDEVDAVELEGLLDGQPGTWSNTSAVTQNGHTYNVYQHSNDPNLQVLIDQHIATSNVHSS